ncbi:unnamed protein product, partial [Rotaria sp. Silwood1]
FRSSKTLLTEQNNLIVKTLVENEYRVDLVKTKINNKIQQFNEHILPKPLKTTLFVTLAYYGAELINFQDPDFIKQRCCQKGCKIKETLQTIKHHNAYNKINHKLITVS